MQFGRPCKIDFHRFNGEDVKGWFFRCHQFFNKDNIAENHKVKMAFIPFNHKALVWHQNFVRKVKKLSGKYMQVPFVTYLTPIIWIQWKK